MHKGRRRPPKGDLHYFCLGGVLGIRWRHRLPKSNRSADMKRVYRFVFEWYKSPAVKVYDFCGETFWAHGINHGNAFLWKVLKPVSWQVLYLGSRFLEHSCFMVSLVNLCAASHSRKGNACNKQSSASTSKALLKPIRHTIDYLNVLQDVTTLVLHVFSGNVPLLRPFDLIFKAADAELRREAESGLR